MPSAKPAHPLRRRLVPPSGDGHRTLPGVSIEASPDMVYPHEIRALRGSDGECQGQHLLDSRLESQTVIRARPPGLHEAPLLLGRGRRAALLGGNQVRRRGSPGTQVIRHPAFFPGVHGLPRISAQDIASGSRRAFQASPPRRGAGNTLTGGIAPLGWVVEGLARTRGGASLRSHRRAGRRGDDGARN